MAKKTKRIAFDPKTFLATVDGGRTVTNFHAKDSIFSLGDPADSVFYVQKGKIKIATTSHQGKEAVIAILGPGEFFGEDCLNGQPVRLSAATAMTNAMVMRIGKAEMVRVLNHEPAFAGIFIAHLLTRNSRIQEDLVDQSSTQVKNAWPGPYCYWQISEKKISRKLS